MSSRHGEDQLAEVLSLFGAIGLQFDPRQLGHPVDQARDVRPEQFFDVFVGGVGVFDRVVQQRA